MSRDSIRRLAGSIVRRFASTAVENWNRVVGFRRRMLDAPLPAEEKEQNRQGADQREGGDHDARDRLVAAGKVRLRPDLLHGPHSDDEGGGGQDEVERADQGRRNREDRETQGVRRQREPLLRRL